MSLEIRRWQRVRVLFERCLGWTDEERARLLEELRAEDEGLFRELRELLALDARVDGSMEPPDPGALGEDLVAREIGRRIGPWQLEAVLGRGGMSTVYRAVRVDEEFRQLAAVKLIRRGMDTEDILRRFRIERQVLAGLDHPGIARLLDGGATEEGLPFLVMEYVQGVPVDRYCDDHSLDVEGRLGLFLSIGEAVQHAHEHGVIHRDLKPSNILVTAEGRPKLLDFGIAKVLDTAASSGTVGVTVTELRLMTPEYASPEHVRGCAIGPASDVYSLGVVLYELLSGHRPYRLTTQLRHDLEQAICELQPPRPSAVVGSAPDSRRLRARLAGDLDTIVLMALRKEPERRYATVTELTEDIARSLASRPVLARPDTWRYRASKFVRRNREVVGATLGIVLALVAGLATSTSFWLGEATARSETEGALQRMRALGLAGAAADALDEDTMLALLLAREAVRVDRTPETLSRLHQAVGLVRERRVFRSGGMHVVFSPDGDALLSNSGGAASLWDLDGNLTRFAGHTGGGLTAVRFSPSGEHVLTAGAGDGTARLFDRRGEELARFEHGALQPGRYGGATHAALWVAEFSPDGRYVLTGGADGIARVWNVEDDTEPVALLPGHGGPTRCASFSPDGDHILTASEDSTGRLWRFSAEDGSARFRVALEGHEGPIHCASFSPAGDLVVTASGDSKYGYPKGTKPDRTARVWDLDGREIVKLGGPYPDYEVEWAAFSPNGKEILTGSGDQGGRLWDLERRVLREYPIPASSATQYMCSFSSDGQVVGFCCRDGSSWLFEMTGTPIATLRGHDDEVMSLRFSPDGRSVATASLDRTVRLWSVRDETLPTFRGLRGPVRPALSPDGKRVATASWYQTARIWDVQGTVLARLEGHEDSVLSVRFDAEGGRLVTASADDTARTWDLDGKLLRVFPHPEAGMVRTAAFSPDGAQIATGCNDGSVWWWKTDGTVLRRFPGMSWVSHVEFAADGERLLVALAHQPALILTLADGSMKSLGYQGYHATFTPGGEILIACQDGRVSLVTDGGDPVSFPAHAAVVTWAEMSPNGERIATASEDGTARIWRADGTLEATLRGHEGSVEFALFSPESDRVLTASSDGTVRTWIVDPDELWTLAGERATRDFSLAELLQYEELLGVPATEARELVDGLFDELVLKGRIVARLREGGDLDDDLRETALRFAAELVDSPAAFNAEAWGIARSADRTQEEYERAIRLAAAACELRPDDPLVLNTLGVARYRALRLEAAIETLTRADALNTADPPAGYNRSSDLLFLAMAHHRLGRAAQAERLLEECRELLQGADEPENRAFLLEAEALIEAERAGGA